MCLSSIKLSFLGRPTFLGIFKISNKFNGFLGRPGFLFSPGLGESLIGAVNSSSDSNSSKQVNDLDLSWKGILFSVNKSFGGPLYITSGVVVASDGCVSSLSSIFTSLIFGERLDGCLMGISGIDLICRF